MITDSYLTAVSDNACGNLATDTHYMPKLKSVQIIKRRVKRQLCPRSLKVDYNFFWTTAIIVSGLQRAHKVSNDRRYLDTLAQWFYRRFAEKNHTKHLTCLDTTMHGYTLLQLHRSGHLTCYEPRIHDMANYLLNDLVRTSRGVLPYRQRKTEMVYLDAIGMVSPFLAIYGNTYNRPEAINLASLQIVDFLANGMNSDSGLPYHAYDSITHAVKGLDGWGRGVGWLVYGMAEALEFIPEDHEHYETIRRSFGHLIDILAKRQDKAGYLKWDLSEGDAAIDTSATAMIGYATALGVDTGVLDTKHGAHAERYLQALKRSTDSEGTVLDCSGECGGVGAYSKVYGAYPWAQGPTIGLASILAKTVGNSTT